MPKSGIREMMNSVHQSGFDNMNFSWSAFYQWYRGLLQNPQYRWWTVAATLAYVVSPIDFLPDFMPMIGALDDTVLIGLLVTEMAQLASAQLQAQKERRQPSSATTVDVETVSPEAV
jgi:uncharacterized membrane protein YkvA (DUF1232 family)